jgi:PAS domain S-box-containing protein
MAEQTTNNPNEQDAAFAAQLVHESPDALLALSLEGRVLFWNRGAEAIFGYPACQTVGRDLEELIVPEDQRDEARRALNEVVRSGSAVFEAIRRRKDGALLYVDVSMRRVNAVGGEPFIAVSKKDISANRLKHKLLPNLSHELRTPLNAIIGFAELMYDGKVGPVSPEQHEYLGDILTSSRRLLQLINDVLDLGVTAPPFGRARAGGERSPL